MGYFSALLNDCATVLHKTFDANGSGVYNGEAQKITLSWAKILDEPTAVQVGYVSEILRHQRLKNGRFMSSIGCLPASSVMNSQEWRAWRG